ncbi:hypothetical protein [Brucella intermedia]|uniref:hypothetical protein n=1 Tax=Brucella intermedia TaxID=94625 RepID=UPI00158DE06A|nr:hypothetical protein [Brucella intermedia]NYD84409.1 hypothetical protein [Brucella intermedia]
MPSKELIEKVARVICFETGSMGDPMPVELQRVDRDWQEHTQTAKAAIFAIRAALQEPDQSMLGAASDYSLNTFTVCGAGYWRVMFAASALGEQSE